MTTTWDTTRLSIAEALRGMRDGLVASWEQQVARQLPPLAVLPRPALVDPVRELFACATAALAADRPDVPEAVAIHSRARTTAGLGIDVVAREYACMNGVLRDALFAVVPLAAARDAVTALDTMLDDWESAAMATSLRELELSRERLIAILAHDLRTPLACVTMAAEMLTDDERLEGLQGQILGAADRMQRMVSDMLELARSQLGQDLPVSPKPDDLGTICRSAIGELAIAYPERAIAFDHAGDLRGDFDRDRVVQAISNVVRNAIEHGIGTVHVRVGEAADHRALVVEVTNMRAANASGALPVVSRRADGRAGFGLYIVHKIVEAHGGACTHETTPVKTIYTLRWPRAASSQRPYPLSDRGLGVR